VENKIFREIKGYFQQTAIVPKKKKWYLLFGYLLFCVHLSCCILGEPRHLATVQPKVENILGTWELKNVEDFTDFQSESIYISLNADESFEANLPDSFFDSLGLSERKTKEVQGKWKLVDDSEGHWMVTLIIEENRGLTMSVELNSPPHRLSRYIGDADKNEIISFVQK